MHPTRWGDPARAAALPDTARGLVELVFPVTDRRVARRRRSRSRRPACPTRSWATSPPWSAPSTCSPTTSRVGSAPAASRRPTCCEPAPVTCPTRRTRSCARATTTRCRHCSRWPPGTGSRSYPFGGGTSVVGGLVARRDGYAGVVSLDLVRMKRLLAVDPVSMTATLEPGLRGPGGRGAAGRARADPGALPAVVRVRDDRRLRGDPVERPVVGRVRPLRRPRRRDWWSRHRRDPSSSGTRPRAPRAPTCGRCSSARRVRTA